MLANISKENKWTTIWGTGATVPGFVPTNPNINQILPLKFVFFALQNIEEVDIADNLLPSWNELPRNLSL